MRARGLLTRRCIVVASITAILAILSVLLVLTAPDPALPVLNLVLRPYQVAVTAGGHGLVPPAPW